jgi:hypothetical protein
MMYKMVTRFSDQLVKLATGRNLLLLCLLFLLTTSVIFPLMSSLIDDPAGELEKIDTKLYYSPEDLYEIMEPYGEQGRRVYALSHLTADVLFPLVYAFFFGLLISYLFQRGFPKESWVHRLNLVPFGLLIFDLIENLGVVILLLAYPTRMVGLALLTGLVTSAKWMLAGITVTLPLVGAAVWLIMSLRGRSLGD